MRQPAHPLVPVAGAEPMNPMMFAASPSLSIPLPRRCEVSIIGVASAVPLQRWQPCSATQRWNAHLWDYSVGSATWDFGARRDREIHEPLQVEFGGGGAEPRRRRHVQCTTTNHGMSFYGFLTVGDDDVGKLYNLVQFKCGTSSISQAGYPVERVLVVPKSSAHVIKIRSLDRMWTCRTWLGTVLMHSPSLRTVLDTANKFRDYICILLTFYHETDQKYGRRGTLYHVWRSISSLKEAFLVVLRDNGHNTYRSKHTLY
jgi:hypothetical protein